MIYSRHYNFCFIHIPRSAGMSITHSLANGCFDCCCVYTDSRRHMAARDAMKEIGPQWDSMFRFAVIRNPWRVIESDYRLCFRDHNCEGMGPEWAERAKRAASGTFSDFVLNEWLSGQICNGGIWRTWTEPGVEPIFYWELPEKWVYICNRIGVKMDLPFLNGTGPDKPEEWTPEAIDGVRERCCDDFKWFGWPQSPWR